MSGPVARLLPDGRRLHCQHGPIDLIVEAFAPSDVRQRAYCAAFDAFSSVLSDLVAYLPDLRRPVVERAAWALSPAPGQQVAAAMMRAAQSHAPQFVTPMAAVAGAVADHVLTAMIAAAPCARAYVNNGGDIALHLSQGQQLTAAGGPHLSSRIGVRAAHPVRGIATSGWRGRSWSLGIADAVTVLAPTAAEADIAATLIANAVDLPGHPSIRRAPASQHDPDSDLGTREVTVAVGPLSQVETGTALTRGLSQARAMLGGGQIAGAALWLNDQCLTCGHSSIQQPEHIHA